MTRPSREAKGEIRAVFQGFGAAAIERVKTLNALSPSDKAQGAHRWSADVDTETLERVREAMRNG